MKIKNNLEKSKSKSIKEIKKEIDTILDKLENKDVNLSNSIEDYKRLVELNKQVDTFFKNRSKEISSIGKKNQKNQ
jgi:exonuclease VII small subunit|tara:strand:+ start:298 stop:525 length:228 start_codon:yes stop_codon:yes gene_type:complete